eukprot:scaffold1354_cov58-Phaeocystis_antarctica.AAC.1
MLARVLTATALLFLPPAATACPPGWTPSPTSAAWGPRCYVVPPERSTSLFRCVELCKEYEGVPACISSAEENSFVTGELATADDLWLGLYQNETGLGPSKGWDRCVAGNASNFTNWLQGEPQTHCVPEFQGDCTGQYQGQYQYQRDCSFLYAGTGQWGSTLCDESVLPFGSSSSCLCARGSASDAFIGDLEALQATRAFNERLLIEIEREWRERKERESARLHRRRAEIAAAAAVAIAILPTLLLLGRAGWRRLRRGAEAESSVGVQGAATSPSGSATAVALSTPSAAASSAAVKGVLDAARKSAAGRRLHVSFAMGQAGWALSALGLTPAVMELTGRSIEAAVGRTLWCLVPAPLGICLFLLALFPTDARAIRVACITFAVLWTGLGAITIGNTFRGGTHSIGNTFLPDVFGFPLAALFLAAAGALVPTLRCHGDRATQPRPALRRVWIVTRLFFLGVGLLLAGISIADAQRNAFFHHWADPVPMSVIFLLCAALATPRNRGRAHRRLGRLGGRGSKEEEAAAVAALIGGSDPDAALERASKLLRSLPASRLHA